MVLLLHKQLPSMECTCMCGACRVCQTCEGVVFGQCCAVNLVPDIVLDCVGHTLASYPTTRPGCVQLD